MSCFVNPYDAAHDLARAIKNSDIFQDYVQAKKQVEQNPKFSEIVYAIRDKQMMVNRSQILGEKNPEVVQELALEFAKANQHQEIARFFEAEGKFVQMFNDLQEIIQKAMRQELGE